MTLAVKLEPEGVRKLREFFMACSDPQGEGYGKFWTRQDLAENVRSRPGAIAYVQSWLARHGIRALDESSFPGGRVAGIIRARGNVSSIEHAFGVQMWLYTHPLLTRRSEGTEEANPDADGQESWTVARGHRGQEEGLRHEIPRHLVPYLDFVAGIYELPTLGPPLANPHRGGAPTVTPVVLGDLYKLSNVSQQLGTAAFKGSQGAAGWQHQSFNPRDLARFQERHKLAPLPIRRTYGRNSGWGHVEGNLDVEYLTAVSLVAGMQHGSLGGGNGSGVATDYWLSSDVPFGMGFDIVGWAARLLAEADSALVWSVSYGEALAAVSIGYAKRLDVLMQQLGAIGITVVFASGDSGVYSRSGGFDRFNPSFPACLPSVTAVGATQLNASGAEDEGVTWSGGGFSSGGIFDRVRDAPWQAAAVQHYLSNVSALPPSELWEPAGRAFPDLAAVGVAYEVVIERSVRAPGGFLRRVWSLLPYLSVSCLRALAIWLHARARACVRVRACTRVCSGVRIVMKQLLAYPHGRSCVALIMQRMLKNVSYQVQDKLKHGSKSQPPLNHSSCGAC